MTDLDPRVPAVTAYLEGLNSMEPGAMAKHVADVEKMLRVADEAAHA